MAGRTQVLVTYASKMGSTQEIAEAIGRELENFGMQVTVAPCAENVSPTEFDGVIIGSAIYTRRWVKAATKYLKRHRHSLDRHRTWLFHSGPCGEGAGAASRVRRDLLLHYAAMAADGPLAGDFRDWDRIRAWASDIARQLDPATAGTQQQ